MEKKTIIGIIAVITLFFVGWGLYRVLGFSRVVPAQPSTSVSPTGELLNPDYTIVQTTNGVQHTVPLNEIRGGGPPKDGIPPIDNPKFISITEADEVLDDSAPGVAVAFADQARFYPFNILVWHEIVNDTFDDTRVLISYCPLCLSGIVFDPVVDGERVEFGTSGKLWNSNLVMYDRKNESYWSQILGTAIVGENAGEQLEVLPSDQMRYGEWKAANPEGVVLSQDTGTARPYDRDPYGDYYTTAGTIFPLSNTDDRLFDKEYVLGVVINGQAKAYVPAAVQKVGFVEDEVGGTAIIAEYDASLDVVQLFTIDEFGARTRLNPFPTFWFSWAASYPQSEIYAE